MTILALRMSRHANGVSKLHGEVSRGLWKDVWAGVPMHEVPITSITNGIHTKTWMAPEFSALYRKYLGDWEEHLTEPDFWRGVIDIPDAQLWETHQKLKLRLVEFVRERVRTRRERLGESPEAIRQGQPDPRSGDPDDRVCPTFCHLQARHACCLAIRSGCSVCSTTPRARCNLFLPAKRIRATKAAKALIQEVYKFSREAGFENRIVFVEDYDTYIARRLVQGVDLWLNQSVASAGSERHERNEIAAQRRDQSECARWLVVRRLQRQQRLGHRRRDRPMGRSSSKTKSMPAVSINCSKTRSCPLYYAKPDGKLPLAWLQLMRESIRSITPVFNTHRMVKEYTERLYIPAAKCARRFFPRQLRGRDGVEPVESQNAQGLAQVRISDVQVGNQDRQNIPVGESLQLSARIHLGAVDPKHVRVEAYHGEAENGGIKNPSVAFSTKASMTAMAAIFIAAPSLPRKAAPTDSVSASSQRIRI